MKRILLSLCLLTATAAGFSSLTGCVVHEHDRVVEHDHGWDHHDVDHHDYHDHHDDHVDVHW
jgi:hypothetical protein